MQSSVDEFLMVEAENINDALGCVAKREPLWTPIQYLECGPQEMESLGERASEGARA